MCADRQIHSAAGLMAVQAALWRHSSLLEALDRN